MAQVNAVEVTDRENGSRKRPVQSLDAAENLHSGFLKGVPAGVDLRVGRVERVVLAVRRSQIAVDAAVRQVLAVAAEERALVDELAAEPAAVAVTLAAGRDRLRDVVLLERTEVRPAGLAQDLADQVPGHDFARVPGLQAEGQAECVRTGF